MSATSIASQLWAKADRPGVRAFFLSMTALTIALVLALYSGAAAELGRLVLASTTALAALAVAGWVAVTLVPVLARRTPLRWIGYKMEYKVTREGWIYIGGVLLISLAALNTGNNLLFLILACLIAVILMSGILSSITLSGVEVRLRLPEHIFANQRVRAAVELQNEKITLPSFSIRAEAISSKDSPAALFETPVYFPYLPRQDTVEQSMPITFPRRGVYRQDTFRIITRFPFGFLQKARRLDLKTDAVVYPSVEPTQEFLEVLPGLQGALESQFKGMGQDLFGLRDYLPNDSARHVHWKASARLGSLMVREFAREDDCRVLLILDPYLPPARQESDARGASAPSEDFDRAVTFCAELAWHFYQRNAYIQFRSLGVETPIAPAEAVIFTILRQLAVAKPSAPENDQQELFALAGDLALFKVIVTCRPRGSIPAPLWHSSYVVFIEDQRS